MEVNSENNDENNYLDVNINSWIFIEKHTLNEPVNTEAGIQQLTEDDLKSTKSNSDSDGISVISENESLQSQDECCTCLSEVKEQDDKEIYRNNIDTHKYEENTYTHTNTDSLENSQIMPKDSVAKNKIIYITTVTGMCFLATYFFWPKTVDLQEYISDKIIHSELNTDMINDDILNNVYDKQIWNHYEQYNNTCDPTVDLSQNKLHDFNSGDRYMYQSIIQKDFSIKNNKNLNLCNTQRQKVSNNKPKKDNIKFKNKRHKSLKLKEDFLYKKDKYLIKKEKYLKKIKKEINLLEAKLQKTYSRIKKEGNNYLHKNKLSRQKKIKVNSKKPTQQNVTGDWYHNMYSGRSEFRYKEKLSDWVFDRSKMRSKLREKESWYFSRVKGREQFRSSEKYKIYKSYRY